MAPTPKSTLRAIVALSLIAMVIPFAAFQAVAEHDGTKDPHQTDCRRAFAAISGVAAGGVTLQTQAGGQTFELNRKDLNVAVSTTGTLDVTVKHDCIRMYTLTATVNGALGTNTYTFTMYPACVGGVDVHSVPVGNDVADVQLTLKWIGCDGTSGSDVRDIKVVDPALPNLL